MRRLLLLLLGLLLLHQGHCFEFVIDGEWEDDSSDVEVPPGRHKRAVLTSEEQEDFEVGPSSCCRSLFTVTELNLI